MTPPNRTSLKTKLAFFAILLVAFAVLGSGYFIRVGQKQSIVDAQEIVQRQTVAALRSVAKDAIVLEDDTQIVNYIRTLSRVPSVAYAMVLDPTGRVRVHSDTALFGQLLNDPATLKTLENREPVRTVTQNVLYNGEPVMELSMPVLTGDLQNDYRGVARIGFYKRGIDEKVAEALRAVDRQIKQAIALALVLGVAGAWVLALFITRPLEILRAGARRIGEGHLDQRIEVPTNDEIRELADEFNLMAEKLKELDEMKQDFVSNVTHELRSPMTSIRGYIDLLLQGAGGDVTDLQKDYLSVIKNSAVRLARFIDNLLDVAKIEAHKLKLTPEPLHVRTLAHEMEVLFKPQLDEKTLRFDNEIPEALADAFADKDKLAEVLINLVSNAIKFTPEKGHVAMAAVEGPNYIEMSVQDSGVGIPPDQVGKLFSKFEQVKANQGHARKHKGTGLGLTIAKGIIEAHGGKIWIKSPGPSGVGTAFFFTVPKMTEELKSRHSGMS